MTLSGAAAPAFVVSVLDRHETELVEQALAAVTTSSPADAEILKNLIEELKATASLLDRQRPLRSRSDAVALSSSIRFFKISAPHTARRRAA